MVVTRVPRLSPELLAANRIRLDKDGQWYHDGHPVTHERTVELFHRSIDWDAAGNFYLHIGSEVFPIDIEDAPFRVMDVEGDGARGFTLHLSDGTREPLDPATLRIGADNALYCTVKAVHAPARFSRAAHYRLAQHIREDGDRFVLTVGDRTVAIASS